MKQEAIDQGAKITHESKLITSFTYGCLVLQDSSDTNVGRAEFPKDKVHTLSSNNDVSVEADQEVKTQ